LLNVTWFPLSIEKLVQSIMPRPEVWLIVNDVPEPLMEPFPATNLPPLGNGPAPYAGNVSARVSAIGARAGSVLLRQQRECLIPAVRSITAISYRYACGAAPTGDVHWNWASRRLHVELSTIESGA
jgi:hypothetical protein